MNTFQLNRLYCASVFHPAKYSDSIPVSVHSDDLCQSCPKGLSPLGSY